MLGRSWWKLAALGGACGSALGCGALLGVDDYAIAEPGPDDAGTSGTAELPILPAVPDANQKDGCEACVREQCLDRLEACRASPSCRDMVECTAKCSDPNCLGKCWDEHRLSGPFLSYFACAFTQAGDVLGRFDAPCATSCTPNWDCVGKYDWDVVPAGPLKTDLEIVNSVPALSAVGGPPPTFDAAEVANCTYVFPTPGQDPSGESGCSGWTRIDPYGHATLNLLNSEAIAVRGLPGSGPQRDRVYRRPVLRPTSNGARVRLSVTGTGEVTNAAGSLITPDATRAQVVATLSDCLSSLAAADIRLDAAADPGRVRAYYTVQGQLDPALSTGEIAVFAGVEPAQSVSFTAFLESRSVSMRTALVAAGWATTVDLYPLTKKQAGTR